jgi:hypothetical protein
MERIRISGKTQKESMRGDITQCTIPPEKRNEIEVHAIPEPPVPLLGKNSYTFHGEEEGFVGTRRCLIL